MKISFIGDTHIGNINTDIKAIQSAMKKADKIIFMGDIIEGISKKDKRHDNEDTNLTVDEQIIKAIEIIKPYKRKFINFIEGNHSQTVHSIMDIDVVGMICKPLNIEHCYTTLFNIDGLNIFATHGTGAAATYQGAVSKLINYSKDHIADYYLMGHTHKLFDMQISRDPNNFCIVNTGCFVGQAEYAKKRAYPPPIQGYYILDTLKRKLTKVKI